MAAIERQASQQDADIPASPRSTSSVSLSDISIAFDEGAEDDFEIVSSFSEDDQQHQRVVSIHSSASDLVHLNAANDDITPTASFSRSRSTPGLNLRFPDPTGLDDNSPWIATPADENQNSTSTLTSASLALNNGESIPKQDLSDTVEWVMESQAAINQVEQVEHLEKQAEIMAKPVEKVMVEQPSHAYVKALRTRNILSAAALGLALIATASYSIWPRSTQVILQPLHTPIAVQVSVATSILALPSPSALPPLLLTSGRIDVGKDDKDEVKTPAIALPVKCVQCALSTVPESPVASSPINTPIEEPNNVQKSEPSLFLLDAPQATDLIFKLLSRTRSFSHGLIDPFRPGNLGFSTPDTWESISKLRRHYKNYMPKKQNLKNALAKIKESKRNPIRVEGRQRVKKQARALLDRTGKKVKAVKSRGKEKWPKVKIDAKRKLRAWKREKVLVKKAQRTVKKRSSGHRSGHKKRD